VGEQGKRPLTILFQYSFSLYYTLAACINSLPKPWCFRIGVLWLVVLLSPTVMGVIQVFPSLWCWVWLVLSVEGVGLLSLLMWGDRGEIRCCRTSLSIFMMLSLTCVECGECWSSISPDVRWPWWDSMMWFEQGLLYWRWLESIRSCGLSCSSLLRTEF
jgi:hypothetical protein